MINGETTKRCIKGKTMNLHIYFPTFFYNPSDTWIREGSSVKALFLYMPKCQLA